MRGVESVAVWISEFHAFTVLAEIQIVLMYGSSSYRLLNVGFYQLSV